MTDIVERLRAPLIDHATLHEAADEIERLRTDKNQLIAIAADEMRMRDAEIERLRNHVSDALAVLNACRITIKNRDQRPDEMKLLDAIKIVIAEIEP